MRDKLRVCAFVFILVLAAGFFVSPVVAHVSANSASLNFGSVNVNTLSPPTVIVLTNTGDRPAAIQKAFSSSSQFIVTRPALPLMLQAQQSISFQVVFNPNVVSVISAKFTVTIVRHSVGDFVVPRTGTGVALPTPTYLLLASAENLAFGSISVGTSSSQTVTLTNSGNFAVTISQLNITGAGFSHSGLSLPITLAAGPSTNFSAIFDPTIAGGAGGAATVVSTATNSPQFIARSGSGAAPVTHSISLSWQPSTSSVVGYYVYEDSQSGGPYTRMNSTPCPVTTFSDTNVVAGDANYFTTTAADSIGVESAYSNQVTALVP